MKLIKKRGSYWPASASEREIKEISRLARYHFPDMEDSQIAENFDVFQNYYRGRGSMDGHNLSLRIDPNTGQVYESIHAPYTVKRRE